MRSASQQLQELLGQVTFDDLFSDGPLSVAYVADVMDGSDRRLEQVELDEVSLKWDSAAMVECQGSATVVHVPDEGESWAPQEPGDALAPYGPELVISARVEAGPLVEEVPLAVLRITDKGDAEQSRTTITGESIVTAERIPLTLEDRMRSVVRDRFTKATSPSILSSAYRELEALTGRPVVRSLPDKAIVGISAYDERDQAVQDLAQLLGGDAHFDSGGRLRVRSSTPGAPVAVLVLGPYGRVDKLTSAMSADRVYNGAIVRGKNALGVEFQVERWITTGPLATSRYGRVPVFYQSDLLRTLAQAGERADRLLAEKSQPRAASWKVECLWNPLIEVGDVVTVQRAQGSLNLMVTRVDLGLPMMTIEGDEV